MKALLLLLAFAAAPAFADTTVVATPGKWVLRNPKAPDKDTRYDTQALCEAAAKATVTVSGAYQCNTSVALAVTVTCPVKPIIPRVLDAAGYLTQPGIRGKPKVGSDTEIVTEIEDYVSAPPPMCWVKGWRVAALDDLFDPSAYLAGAEPYDHAADWPPELQANWDSPESRARRFNHAVDGDDEIVGTP